MKQRKKQEVKSKAVAHNVSQRAGKAYAGKQQQHSTHTPVQLMRRGITMPVFQPETGNQKTITVQRAKGDKRKKNYYEEVDISKNKKPKLSLEKLKKKDYDLLDEESPSTDEGGYEKINLEKKKKDDISDNWSINANVLKWNNKKSQMEALRTFNLPVSCIESTEHIMHHTKNSKKIPDFKSDNKKSVDLFFQNEKQENEKALNVSKDKLSNLKDKNFTSFSFDKDPIKLNEGLLVINPEALENSVHAVVVVGVNSKTGQLIVVERNAGTTSGSIFYVDQNWLLNVYNSPEAFLQSMKNDKMIIGKLVAN